MGKLVIDNISSLNLVKEEIQLTLDEATKLLDSFVQGQKDKSLLEDTLKLFSQVHGVLSLIGLKGAIILIGEIEYLLREILENELDKTPVEKRIFAIGNGMINLSHYMEYVQVKDRSVPLLLMNPINEMRKVTKRVPLPESSFVQLDYKLDCELEAIEMEFPETPSDINDVRKKSRRFRHMYQVGMLGVFTDNQVKLHLKLMERALTGVLKLCGRTNIAKLWWTSKGLIQSMSESDMPINDARKLLLGKIDRELKQLVYGRKESIDAEVSQSLIKHIMCIVGLSASDARLIKQLKDTFKIHFSFNEEQLVEELKVMNGPDGSVILTVTNAITEELTQVKDQLDLVARGVSVVQSYSDISRVMVKITQTLVMLGLIDAANVLRNQAEIVDALSDEEKVLEVEEYSKIADAILFVENGLFELQRVSKVSNPLDLEQENKDISLSQLEEARHMVVLESRTGLSVAKRAISSYVDSHCDDIHLNNLPGSLITIAGGLNFLHLSRVAKVIKQCSHYIGHQLIGASERPEVYSLETLADALSSVDYYLESMETNKPIGDGVLEVAEESIAELGLGELEVGA